MGTRLWHDDVRPAPPGWTWWAKDNESAKFALTNSAVEECSLDHDLGATPTGSDQDVFLRGAGEETGLDLVRWMIENDRVPSKVVIHSWNVSGARNMANALNDAGYDCNLAPYEVSAA